MKSFLLFSLLFVLVLTSFASAETFTQRSDSIDTFKKYSIHTDFGDYDMGLKIKKPDNSDLNISKHFDFSAAKVRNITVNGVTKQQALADGLFFGALTKTVMPPDIREYTVIWFVNYTGEAILDEENSQIIEAKADCTPTRTGQHCTQTVVNFGWGFLEKPGNENATITWSALETNGVTTGYKVSITNLTDPDPAITRLGSSIPGVIDHNNTRQSPVDTDLTLNNSVAGQGLVVQPLDLEGNFTVQNITLNHYQDFTCADDVTALFRFEEGTGTTTTDECQNLTLTGTNSPGWESNRLGTYNAKFDRGSAEDFSTSSSAIQISGEFFVGAWVNFTGENVAGGNPMTIISHFSASTGYILKIESNVLGGLVQSGSFTLTDPSTFSNNTWEFVGIGWNGTHRILYRNATIVDSEVLATSPNTTSTFYIGRYSGGTSAFNGSIDSAIILNRTITLAELQTIYDATKPSYDDDQANVTAELRVAGESNTSISYNPPQNESLQFFYSFDYGLTDLTGSSTAEYANGAHSNTSFIANGSEYDGTNDWINTTISPPVNNFTYAWWGYADDVTDEFFFHGGNSTNEIAFRIVSGDLEPILNGLFWGTFYTVEASKWYHYGWIRNGSDNNLYINGQFVSNFTHSNQLDFVGCHLNLGVDADGGLCDNALGNWYNGQIDQLMIWNTSLSATEMEGLYKNQSLKYKSDFTNSYNTTDVTGRFVQTKFHFNSTSTLISEYLSNHTVGYEEISFSTPAPPSVDTIINTSVLIFSLDVNESSTLNVQDEWFDVERVEINLSDTVNVTFHNAQTFRRDSGGGDRSIFINLSIDGVEQAYQEVVTLSGADTLVASLKNAPTFELSAGNHTIDIQYKFTGGAATIEVEHIDWIIYTHEMNSLTHLAENVTAYSFSHSSTSPEVLLTVDPTDYGEGFIWGKISLTKNSAGTDTIDYWYQNNDNGSKSSIMTRHLSGAGNIGSLVLGPFAFDNLTSNISLYAQTTNGDTIESNVTFQQYQTKVGEERIQKSITSNNNTNKTNTVSYTAGLHNIHNVSFTLLNGTAIFNTFRTSIGSSSGAQTVQVFLNISSQNCLTQKTRQISSNNDIGNIYGFGECESLTVGTTYTADLLLNVSTGETAVVYDESILLVESISKNVTPLQTQPAPQANETISIFLSSPANGSSITTLTPTFQFIYNHGEGITGNCTLYINNTQAGTENCTSASTTSITSNLTLVNLTTYDWFIKGVAGLNETNSTSWEFTINITGVSTTSTSGTTHELAYLLAFFIVIWLFCKVGSMLETKDNSFLTGAKLALLGFAYTFSVLALGLGREIAVQNGESSSIINIFNTAWTLSIWFSYSIVAVITLWAIWKAIMMWVDIRG